MVPRTEPAYGRLAGEASRLSGLPVTGRQVERWAEQGLLPLPERRGRGRGRGQHFVYPEGTAEVVAALAAAVRHYRSVPDAVLACFARGLPIRKRALERAYEDSYKRLRHGIEKLAEVGTGKPILADIAVWTGQPLTARPSQWPAVKAMRDRLREAGRGSSLAEVVGTGVAVMVGSPVEQLHEDSLTAVLGRDGAERIARWLGTDDDPLAQVASNLVSALSLEGLEARVKRSSLRELARARDVLRVLAEVAYILARRGGIVGGIARAVYPGLRDDLARAFWVPVLLWAVETAERIGGSTSEAVRVWDDLLDLPEEAFSDPSEAARLFLQMIGRGLGESAA